MKKLNSIQNLLLRGIYRRDETLEYLCRCAINGVNGVKLYHCLTTCSIAGVVTIFIIPFLLVELCFGYDVGDTIYSGEGWSIISLIVGSLIGYRIGKYAQQLVKEIAKCPNCEQTTLNLTKEDIVTENVIRTIEGQTKRKAVHYRIGNKTAFFQCSSCGYEDSLNTPYREKI